MSSYPTIQPYGKTRAGKPVDLYTLTNDAGMEVSITNYGGTVVSLKVPNSDGKPEDVVLGYDRLEDYEDGQSFFGGTIGRYANRIAHGKFTLDGKVYCLPRNSDGNTLHGGVDGFNKRVWLAKDVSGNSGQALQITYLSRDGEEGFPGDLSVTATFTLPANRNELRIDYAATTNSKGTILNLTNHSFFNLSGAGKEDISDHQLMLNAQQFIPVDADLIPTGKFEEAAGTPFDFTRTTAIGYRIGEDNEQLKFGHGYDHTWALDHPQPGSLELAAEAYDPKSGRMLFVYTTEPGVHLYTGNFLNGTVRGKGGRTYGHRSAFCLETQHFPDSPNQPQFPPVVLRSGQNFRSTTVYAFWAR
jgi:aldose 1-epimerase